MVFGVRHALHLQSDSCSVPCACIHCAGHFLMTQHAMSDYQMSDA